MDKWIIYYNKKTGEELARTSVDGLFVGEIQATKELLAYGHNLSLSDIEFKTE